MYAIYHCSKEGKCEMPLEFLYLDRIVSVFILVTIRHMSVSVPDSF